MWSLVLSREDLLLINQIIIKCLSSSSCCHLPPVSTSFFLSLWNMEIRGEGGKPETEGVIFFPCSLNLMFLRVKYSLFNLMLNIYFFLFSNLSNSVIILSYKLYSILECAEYCHGYYYIRLKTNWEMNDPFYGSKNKGSWRLSYLNH